jgi:hypothetical protein
MRRELSHGEMRSKKDSVARLALLITISLRETNQALMRTTLIPSESSKTNDLMPSHKVPPPKDFTVSQHDYMRN